MKYKQIQKDSYNMQFLEMHFSISDFNQIDQYKSEH